MPLLTALHSAPHKGRKAFMLQSLPPLTSNRAGEPVAQAAGFSLHAGVAAPVHQRNKLERLCRYITRPPVAIERLALTTQGSEAPPAAPSK